VCLVFVVNAWWARRAGVVAGDNPWAADTLEWSTSSPPPNYNFHNMPVVQGRYPIWQATEDAPVVRGLSTTKRETLVTSVMDAQPELRFDIPGPSIWPSLVALATGVTFIAGIFYALGVSGRRDSGRHHTYLAGSSRIQIMKTRLRAKPANALKQLRRSARIATEGSMSTRAVIDVSELPHHEFDTYDPVWWGNNLLLAIETSMFGF
jgi:hypothetical protein